MPTHRPRAPTSDELLAEAGLVRSDAPDPPEQQREGEKLLGYELYHDLHPDAPEDEERKQQCAREEKRRGWRDIRQQLSGLVLLVFTLTLFSEWRTIHHPWRWLGILLVLASVLFRRFMIAT